MTKTKAIGLVSGGLDSLLALKLMLDQNIEVIALYFTSPFFGKNKEILKKTVEQLGAKFKQVDIGKEYIEIVKKPKFGHGKHLNPCIDCKMFMLKKAKQIMKKTKSDFVFTGEVLGQRPMSQHHKALHLIERETGLKGLLLRPLCAKLLEQTVPEKTNLVNRNKLLDIQGRQRKIQISLAKQYNITNYSTPAGGCLLTNKEYCKKLKDYLDHSEESNIQEVELLKIGRHFRLTNDTKIIVGRNETDNDELLQYKQNDNIILEARDTVGPITLLIGKSAMRNIKLAAMITARYSDDLNKIVNIIYFSGNTKKTIKVHKIDNKLLEKYRI